jgi:hypothetical protein
VKVNRLPPNSTPAALRFHQVSRTSAVIPQCFLDTDAAERERRPDVDRDVGQARAHSEARPADLSRYFVRGGLIRSWRMKPAELQSSTGSGDQAAFLRPRALGSGALSTLAEALALRPRPSDLASDERWAE